MDLTIKSDGSGVADGFNETPSVSWPTHMSGDRLSFIIEEHCMDKQILNDTLALFTPLSAIKARSMFGGYGIFSGEIMFALIVQGQLHLRAGQDNEATFQAAQLKPYVYRKKGFPVITKHYAIPTDWWDDKNALLTQAKIALSIAQYDKQKKTQTSAHRIKDLPNLRLANERMLKKVGITTVEALMKTGALNAYKAIQAQHKEPLQIELLLALEGAIDGKHWSVISKHRRHELMSRLNS